MLRLSGFELYSRWVPLTVLCLIITIDIVVACTVLCLIVTIDTDVVFSSTAMWVLSGNNGAD